MGVRARLSFSLSLFLAVVAAWCLRKAHALSFRAYRPIEGGDPWEVAMPAIGRALRLDGLNQSYALANALDELTRGRLVQACIVNGIPERLEARIRAGLLQAGRRL
jgi:hypothetical protein